MVDCPCVLKDESTRKMSSLNGQLRNKKGIYYAWKEGQISQEVFKGASRACGKKLQRSKLSLNLIRQLL